MVFENGIKKLKYNLLLHTGIVVFFFLLSFVINRISAGTFINPGENLFKLFFTWFDKSQSGYNTIISSPFYIFQNILYNLGFSYSNIANTIMFLFFIIAFYSFFSAIKIVSYLKREGGQWNHEVIKIYERKKIRLVYLSIIVYPPCSISCF